MSTISPLALERAMSAAQQVKQLLIGYSDEDLLASLESETNALELLDRLTESAVADKELAEKASERAKRLKERSERARDIVKRMLEALGVSKIERSLATLSISDGPRTAVVTDEDLLPTIFFRRAVDKAELLKALKAGPVVGAEISNGPPVLRISTR